MFHTAFCKKHSVREDHPQGRPKGQPEGDAVKGKTRKRWVEKEIDRMRKHDEDENSTNHDNRSLTPQVKQFMSDEMGIT